MREGRRYLSAHQRWLFPLFAAPAMVVCAPLYAQTVVPPQVMAPVPADPDPDAGPTVDPQSPMAELPGMGVDWPDMGQPDTVIPLQADSGDALPGTPVEEAAQEPVASDGAVADAGNAEAGSGDDGAPADSAITGERRYRVALDGLDGVTDETFDLRFREGSALRIAEGKSANIAQINRRAREDDDLLDQLMRAKGYYNARIVHGIEAGATEADRLTVRFTIVPGVRYLLSDVTLDGLEAAGDKTETVRSAFPVKVGDPADADAITAGQAALAAALGENGFPFGKVEEPLLRVDHQTRESQLTVKVEPGGYRLFGNIVVTSAKPFGAKHVQEIARWHRDDMFQASDVEDLRRALVATGLISSMKIEPRDTGDGVHADLAIDFQPAPPRTIAGELGYGTGEGARVEASWQHRNLFPPEGALTVRGVLGTQEQSGSLIFRRSNFHRRDHVLNAQIVASHINRSAYDARTLQFLGSIERQTNLIFQKKWVWSIGTEFLASQERGNSNAINNGGGAIIGPRRTYLIAALPGNLTYDGSDDLLNPTHGFRLGGRLSPELSFQNSTFGYVRAQIDGSVYMPVREKVTIAARARLGSILGSSAERIAPSRRFYAGGGGSVRGYGYQDIGPRDANNDPIGGKSLAEFSLEARVRFGNFGVVPFVDAGNISSSVLPKFDNLRIGAGLGFRYYSNFGPIRVDVGTPINPAKGDPRVAVYVSLGQAF